MAIKSWRQRIVDAWARGNKFTKDDKNRARKWVSCAVGEQRQLVGDDVVQYREIGKDGVVSVNELSWAMRYGDYYPKDKVLQRLGGEFYSAVDINHVKDAEKYLEKIEDRVMKLKREKTV